MDGNIPQMIDFGTGPVAHLQCDQIWQFIGL